VISDTPDKYSRISVTPMPDNLQSNTYVHVCMLSKQHIHRAAIKYLPIADPTFLRWVGRDIFVFCLWGVINT